MNKLKIKTKIMLTFGGAAVLCAGLAVAAIITASNTALFIIAFLLPVVFITFGIILSGNISKPLKFLAECISGISDSGNIFLDDNAYKQTKELNKRADDIGNISRSIGDLLAMFREKIKSLNAVKNGDLTVEIINRSDKDTVGAALVSMVKSLSEMFADIKEVSHIVSDGSSRMDSEARQLADGSSEQAEAVHKLSLTISDVSEQTSQNAQMSAQSAELSRSVKLLAEKGGGQMEEMIDAVKDINEASQNISKVIKVIDDIAFQTNILALNAAVEAARAGGHGKGFAVVAEEVRNLASKSAEAAKNTGGMIADSMEKARLGSRIASETAESFRQIIDSITESANLANQISSLTEKQAGIIAEINSSIEVINDTVRRNSRTADESARDSLEVSKQSEILRESIGRFKIQ